MIRATIFGLTLGLLASPGIAATSFAAGGGDPSLVGASLPSAVTPPSSVDLSVAFTDVPTGVSIVVPFAWTPVSSMNASAVANTGFDPFFFGLDTLEEGDVIQNSAQVSGTVSPTGNLTSVAGANVFFSLSLINATGSSQDVTLDFSYFGFAYAEVMDAGTDTANAFAGLSITGDFATIADDASANVPSGGGLVEADSFEGSDTVIITLASGQISTVSAILSVNGDASTMPQPIPLPAGGWLILGGLGALVLLRRRAQSTA